MDFVFWYSLLSLSFCGLAKNLVLLRTGRGEGIVRGEGMRREKEPEKGGEGRTSQ